MQDEIIRLASDRLCRPLSEKSISVVRQNKWGYMGLEFMIDTVTTLDPTKIEDYLSNAD